MASHTTAPGVFTAGETVSAYADGDTTLPAATTAVAAGSGAVTFNDLAENVQYLLRGNTSGARRLVYVESAQAGGSSGGIGVDVTTLGAVGDGVHNDGPAIQAAIDAGKLIYFPNPPVEYRCLQELVVPADETRELVGEHRGVKIRFPNDLGAGKFIVTHDGAAWNESTLTIRKLHFYGPYELTAIGSTPADMGGLRLWRNWHFEDVKVEGFGTGVHVDGDHGTGVRLDLTRNFDNLYYGPAPGTKGDHSFRDCDFAEAYRSSLAIAPSNTIEYALFDRCHFGYAPFCVYREAMAGVGQIAMAIFETVFLLCDFEAFGNAMFYDETPGSDIDGLKLDKCGQGNVATDGTFNATYFWAAKPRTYAFRWNNVKRVTIEGSATILSEPGGTGIIRCNGFLSRLEWTQAQQPIVNAQARNKPIFDVAGAFNRLRMRDGADEFIVAKNGAATAIEQFEPVETYSFQLVERWAGTTPGECIVGVAAHRADQNEFLPVQVRGETFIKSNDATLNSYGQPIKPGAAGLVVKAADFSDATVIARTIDVQAAGQVLAILRTRE